MDFTTLDSAELQGIDGGGWVLSGFPMNVVLLSNYVDTAAPVAAPGVSGNWFAICQQVINNCIANGSTTPIA